MDVKRFLPLVCSTFVVSSSLTAIHASRSIKQERDRLEKEEKVLYQFCTNVVATVTTFRSELAAFESGGQPPTTVETPAARLESIGVIPYEYFRAGTHRGICLRDRPVRIVIGQRCRFGVLTDCGRDFAEFDGEFVYGLNGSGVSGI